MLSPVLVLGYSPAPKPPNFLVLLSLILGEKKKVMSFAQVIHLIHATKLPDRM
jgi:hypothetical protein